MDFFNVLTGPELLEQTEAHLPEHREQLYPPTVSEEAQTKILPVDEKITTSGEMEDHGPQKRCGLMQCHYA